MCGDCSNCRVNKQCIKGNNSKIPFEARTKRLEISKLFHRYLCRDKKNILAESILLAIAHNINTTSQNSMTLSIYYDKIYYILNVQHSYLSFIIYNIPILTFDIEKQL